MTDLTLRPGESFEAALARAARVLKEMFAATPLGIVLAIVRSPR